MTPERLQEIENSIGRIECPACGGSGVYLDGTTGNEACEECDGSGMVSQFAPANLLIAEVRRLTAERDEAHSKLVDVLDGYADYLRAFHRLRVATNTLEQQRDSADATIATMRGGRDEALLRLERLTRWGGGAR